MKQKSGKAGKAPGGGASAEKMSFLQHLTELRTRLVRCAAVLAAAFALCSTRAEWLTGQLLRISDGFSFIYISPSELLLCYLKVALVGAVVLAFPVLLLEIWKFLCPGLTRRERAGVTASLFSGLALFITGVLFCYGVMLPVSLKFLAELGTGSEIAAAVSVANYIGFTLTMMVVFGLVFEMPIVMIALTSVGLVNPIKLRRQRKYAILIIFILAAVLTPPDVTTQVLLGLPMIALFEVSSLVSGVIFRRKLKAEEAEQREAEAACAAAA